MFTYMQTEFTCVCICIYIYAHINYMCVGIYLHACTPGLQLCVRRVYMYVCMYLHTCTRVHIHTEFSCVIFSMFTYVCHHPAEV